MRPSRWLYRPAFARAEPILLGDDVTWLRFAMILILSRIGHPYRSSSSGLIRHMAGRGQRPAHGPVEVVVQLLHGRVRASRDGDPAALAVARPQPPAVTAVGGRSALQLKIADDQQRRLGDLLQRRAAVE